VSDCQVFFYISKTIYHLKLENFNGTFLPGIFFLGDYNENNSIVHILYVHSNNKIVFFFFFFFFFFFKDDESLLRHSRKWTNSTFNAILYFVKDFQEEENDQKLNWDFNIRKKKYLNNANIDNNYTIISVDQKNNLK